MFVAKRITKKREELGLTQAELARRAGLQPATISQYESEARNPSYEALLKLSNALDVSTDYLITGEDTSTHITDPKIKIIFHLLQTMTLEKKNRLLEYATFLSDDPKTNEIIPILDEPSEYAEIVLKKYSVNILPVNLDEIANKLGIKIIMADIHEKGEGIFINGSEKIIIIDSTIRMEERRRFTTALLIGHCVIPWHLKSSYVGRKPGSSTILTESIEEMEAGRFAAALLVPHINFEQDSIIKKPTIDMLKDAAKNSYGVSLFVLANRLAEITKGKYAVIQSENWKILKEYSGNRPIKKSIDPRSKAATFFIEPPQEEEIRSGDIGADCWFEDGDSNVQIHEESIFNPSLGKVLTLLSMG